MSISDVHDGGMSFKELREAVKDFYQYHDPFKSPKEIEDVIIWAGKKGVKALNKKLREKYGEDLFYGEVIPESNGATASTTRVKAFSTLMTPGLGDASLVNASKLAQLEYLLKELEDSDSTKAIKQNLINFYRCATPERFTRKTGEDEPFIEEILNWTYRFGMQALINNLKKKYFSNDDQRPNGSIPNSAFSASSGSLISSAVNLSPEELEDVRNKLIAFYDHYNPARLEKGIDDLLKFARKKGLMRLNEKLRERYADDLDSFSQQNQEALEYRSTLFERLFEFYSTYDQQQINQGLSRIVSWTVKNGEQALNLELEKLYGINLQEFENIAERNALVNVTGEENHNQGNVKQKTLAPPKILDEINRLS